MRNFRSCHSGSLRTLWYMFFVCLIFIGQRGLAQNDSGSSPCTLQITLDGAVGPGLTDYFERAAHRAEERKCDAILFLINTPGGNLQTTRLLVESILSSKIPVLCLVWPAGGHAGSAGAILLQACHVSGAAPATNIGAATPISAAGDLPDDLRKKMIEDTRSWVTGLAHLRGRNEKFAAESITEAKAVDVETAAQMKAIDTVAVDIPSFLKFAGGRPVKMPGDRIEAVKVGPTVDFERDLRVRVLDFLTDPQFAYLLFMASLALLYLEFTHPGVGVPGVLGSLGLIVSMIAFHKLNVWWGGVVLIGLGVIFLIAEAFVASFGILGIGGLIAVTAGSILLYDPAVIGERLPYSLVFGMTGTVGLGMLLLALYIYRSRTSSAKRRGSMELIGRFGKIVSLESPSQRRGMLEVSGELWRFQSDADVGVGRTVEVIDQDGLILKVT